MSNLFQETVLKKKKVIDTIKSKKFQNIDLNLYILIQTTFKPKRILDSNKGR